MDWWLEWQKCRKYKGFRGNFGGREGKDEGGFGIWSECIKVPARGNRQKNTDILSFKYP